MGVDTCNSTATRATTTFAPSAIPTIKAFRVGDALLTRAHFRAPTGFSSIRSRNVVPAAPVAASNWSLPQLPAHQPFFSRRGPLAEKRGRRDQSQATDGIDISSGVESEPGIRITQSSRNYSSV